MPEKGIREYVKTNAKNSGIVYVEYTYKQLGKDEEWLDEVSKTLLYDQMKIKREIHLRRMHGSNLSPFESEDIEALNDMMQEPQKSILLLKRFKIDIYDRIDPKRIYMLGVDCSASVGRDSNAITIVDPYTEKPVAEFKSPYISLPDFRRLIYQIMKELTPRGILCIERNHVGTAVIQELMETEFGNNIYYETGDIMQIDSKMDSDGFLKQEAHSRRIRGIWTGGESRKAMHTILKEYVVEKKESFITKNITADIGKLIVTRTGKIDHAAGHHDDSLMSFLMVLYVLNLGKSLHHFGFVKGLSEQQVEKGLIEEEIEQTYAMMDDMYGEGVFVKPKEFHAEQQSYEQQLQLAHQRSKILDAMMKPTDGAYDRSFEENRHDPNTDIPLDFFDELNS